ncbi:sulfite exporter TauE/SafE family protein [Vibrio sp. SS-MA-C1-2]|uniref:sulfite exporter TauE/SafE family protein n=1 Tax=Vibrio sp. SS-MA-C1-2 TaxID=2908646 RepID=UPI001F32F0C3|nr:sulfite exporter TauE/SafE family protein [Vibrio sp. SS-MA-C1-2]UJF18283.1 sulfite exporter TauE/SafE family protein [Vibrio sp. SS-MA-C1-2]
MADIWWSHTTLMAAGLIFLGAFVQTSVGFGLAIVSAPILFQISPEYVPVPVSIIGLLISILSAHKYRQNIEIGDLKMAIVGRIPGSIAGVFLLLYVSTQTLSLWLGLMVVFAVLISVLPFRLEPTKAKLSIAGFFSGFFGTSSGIGGPPMAILLQHQEANQLRGNLSAFFMFSSTISLIILYFAGLFNWHHLIITIPLIPAAWLGYRIALLTNKRLSKQKVRIAALVLCLVSGFSAIYQGLNV